jgi:hypothetical protein
MKFRRDAVADKTANGTREEVREIAEALSLYRSAMQHIAEREAGRPFAQTIADRRPARTIHFRLVLAPALAAAVAAAVLVPVYGHFHHHDGAGPAPVVKIAHQNAIDTHAAVDDTALMNQIDSEVSEDVPDALRPLADLSDETTTINAVSEKKNATQE